MATSLNLKNEKTVQLAKELASITGESMTTAVTVALEERLERTRTDPKAGLVEWLDELSKITAPLLKNLPASTEIGDLLYDKKTGMPL